MRVLIACEFSGRVRNAFTNRGHDAWSCDLLPTESPGNHYQCDVFDIINQDWDLMIAHPPCTHLAVSGARYFAEKKRDGRQQKAVEFFAMLAIADIPKICIENPVCIMSKRFRSPDQIIEPYMFGHAETKKTCLWLKGLPKLKPTNIVKPEYIIGKDGKKYSPVHYCSQWGNKSMKEERWKTRSRTYQGIAGAMAEQWG